MDELACAEATFAVLRPVLAPIGADHLSNRTPCREYDVAALTEHLVNSIITLGAAAGAQFAPRDPDESVQRQIVAAAEPALAAWQRRGLDGEVSIGPGPFAAKAAAGILSLEFLVHAWDYAAATGGRLEVPDEVADYVLELAHAIITPAGRATVGFDPPVELPSGASAFDRVIAFTGRVPVG